MSLYDYYVKESCEVYVKGLRKIQGTDKNINITTHFRYTTKHQEYHKQGK